MSKNIININLGAGFITTLSVPSSVTEREIVIFDSITGHSIGGGHGVLISTGGDVTGAQSITLTGETINPGGSNTLWLNTTDNSLYLGAVKFGNVVGPASATDNAVARYDSTTGKLIQNSIVLIGDSGDVSGARSLTLTSQAANPGATNTLWLNTTDSSLYLGAAKVGSGNVVGPASSTDNAIVRFDGTTGKLVQNSVVTIGDTGIIDFSSFMRMNVSSTQVLRVGESNNVFLGLNAGNVVSGSNNTCIGDRAGILQGGGNSNVFVGRNAGAASILGGNQIFIGESAGGTSGSSGNDCIGIGTFALAVVSNNSIAVGGSSLRNGGTNSIAIGISAGRGSGTGTPNNSVLIGQSVATSIAAALNSVIIGNSAAFIHTGNFSTSVIIGTSIFSVASTSAVDQNTLIGAFQLSTATGTITENATVGSQILRAVTTGNVAGNAMLGAECLRTIQAHGGVNRNTLLGGRVLYNKTTTGTTLIEDNIIIGYNAGSANLSTANCSGNIWIGSPGAASESNAIRIGNAQTACFVAGVRGVSPTSPQMVTVGTDGQLGSQAFAFGDVSSSISFSVDNRICRFDGTTGKIIQSSSITLTDTGVVGGAQAVNFATVSTNPSTDNTLWVRTSDNHLLFGAIDLLASGVTGGNLVDTSTFIVDVTDATKRIGFDAAGTTGTTTTLAAAQTANRVVNLPDANDTLVGRATTDTLTNKNIVGATNYVEANALKTTGSAVTINGSGPPSNGDFLIATSATTASWITPNLIYPSYATVDMAFSGSDNAADNFTLFVSFAVHGKQVTMQVPGKVIAGSVSNRHFASTLPAGLIPRAAMIGTRNLSYFIPTYMADTATPHIDADINGMCDINSSGLLRLWKEPPPGTGVFNINNRGWPPFCVTWIVDI